MHTYYLVYDEKNMYILSAPVNARWAVNEMNVI